MAGVLRFGCLTLLLLGCAGCTGQQIAGTFRNWCRGDAPCTAHPEPPR